MKMKKISSRWVPGRWEANGRYEPGYWTVDGDVAPHLSRDEQKILGYLRRRPKKGGTSDEIEAHLGMPHQTVSARLNELAALGVVRSGEGKRPTRTGRPAGVYVAEKVVPA